jgi:hypothetical protein
MTGRTPYRNEYFKRAWAQAEIRHRRERTDEDVRAGRKARRELREDEAVWRAAHECAASDGFVGAFFGWGWWGLIAAEVATLIVYGP